MFSYFVCIDDTYLDLVSTSYLNLSSGNLSLYIPYSWRTFLFTVDAECQRFLLVIM